MDRPIWKAYQDKIHTSITYEKLLEKYPNKEDPFIKREVLRKWFNDLIVWQKHRKEYVKNRNLKIEEQKEIQEDYDWKQYDQQYRNGELEQMKKDEEWQELGTTKVINKNSKSGKQKINVGKTEVDDYDEEDDEEQKEEEEIKQDENNKKKQQPEVAEENKAVDADEDGDVNMTEVGVAGAVAQSKKSSSRKVFWKQDFEKPEDFILVPLPVDPKSIDYAYKLIAEACRYDPKEGYSRHGFVVTTNEVGNLKTITTIVVPVDAAAYAVQGGFSKFYNMCGRWFDLREQHHQFGIYKHISSFFLKLE